MSIETWGLMPKSQSDNETIEEAIERLIAEHEADPEAHLSENGSLQSHKASGIIDHLAKSIINDKIELNQITPEQLYSRNRFYINGLQSLDGWTKDLVGVDSDVILEGMGRMTIEAGDVASAKSTARIDITDVGLLSNKNPIIEFKGEDTGGADTCDIAFCLGYSDPFTINNRCVGIKYKLSTNKLYAFVVYYLSGSYTLVEHEISNDYFQQNTYRIEVDDVGKLINWYIGGNLVYSYDFAGKLIFNGDSNICSFQVKRVNTGDTARFSVWNFFLTYQG